MLIQLQQYKWLILYLILVIKISLKYFILSSQYFNISEKTTHMGVLALDTYIGINRRSQGYLDPVIAGTK